MTKCSWGLFGFFTRSFAGMTKCCRWVIVFICAESGAPRLLLARVSQFLHALFRGNGEALSVGYCLPLRHFLDAPTIAVRRVRLLHIIVRGTNRPEQRQARSNRCARSSCRRLATPPGVRPNRLPTSGCRTPLPLRPSRPSSLPKGERTGNAGEEKGGAPSARRLLSRRIPPVVR